MAGSVVALDVAILVPNPVAGPAAAISRALAGDEPDALRLDATHLAHLTLAQQFVEVARLDDLFAELDRVLRHEPPLMLRIPGATADHATVMLAVNATPDLQRVHELVMDAIAPFESPEGDPGAFVEEGETIRVRDIDWVRNYRENSGYAHFNPHVTVGHGRRAPECPPIEFRGDRIAACQLGRFCTCRRVLREWRLGGPAGGGDRQRED